MITTNSPLYQQLFSSLPFADNNYPGTMEAGMTFTVEPIVAQGQEDVLILEDGWTAVMVDNSRAAQFEHTVLITEDGHEILTAEG